MAYCYLTLVRYGNLDKAPVMTKLGYGRERVRVLSWHLPGQIQENDSKPQLTVGLWAEI
jgi:hypothetical protein